MSFHIPQNPGLIPDPIDERDYSYGAVLETVGAVQVDWVTGYDVEKELGIRLKRESQGNSLSCVGQASSKYAEVLNYIETKKFVDLSARDIYSRIYIPETGGANMRDGVKIVVKRGVAPETAVSSYEAGKPPTEAYMRQLELSDKMALPYQGKEYYSVPADIKQFADAIQRTGGLLMGGIGCNRTWQKSDVESPQYSDTLWGHAVYALGLGIRRGQRAIKFLNSWGEDWGEDGCGWLNEDYFKSGRVMSAWVLVDKLNQSMSNVLLVKRVVGNNLELGYYLPATNEASLIAMGKHYAIVIPEVSEGVVDWPQVKPQGEIKGV